MNVFIPLELPKHPEPFIFFYIYFFFLCVFPSVFPLLFPYSKTSIGNFTRNRLAQLCPRKPSRGRNNGQRGIEYSSEIL